MILSEIKESVIFQILDIDEWSRKRWGIIIIEKCWPFQRLYRFETIFLTNTVSIFSFWVCVCNFTFFYNWEVITTRKLVSVFSNAAISHGLSFFLSGSLRSYRTGPFPQFLLFFFHYIFLNPFCKEEINIRNKKYKKWVLFIGNKWVKNISFIIIIIY